MPDYPANRPDDPDQPSPSGRRDRSDRPRWDTPDPALDRPLTRRGQRDADQRERPENEGSWGHEPAEPRWSGRSRLGGTPGETHPEPPVMRPRNRSRSPITAATTGMMRLIRGTRGADPADETNPQGLPPGRPDEQEHLRTRSGRPSFFDMESEAPAPGWTSGDQEYGPVNGARFPSLGGSRTGPPPPRSPQAFRRPKPPRRRLPLIAAALAVLLVVLVGVVYAVHSGGNQSVSPAADATPSEAAVTTPETTQPTKAAAATGAARKVKLGVFKGTSPAQAGEFADWLKGRDVDYAVDYSTRATWDEIANPTYMLSAWQNSGYRMVYAVAMLPTGSRSASLKDGAAGDYDQYYKTLARNLVAYGQGDAIIRLGWEFNVGGWPWHPGSADQQNFVDYWRNVVNAMRSVPGTSKLKFDWNVNNGGDSYDSTLFYPGNKYVDYVGVDVYDTSWDDDAYPYPADCDASCLLAHRQTAWEDVLDATYGLSFWSAFARQQGKKLSLPEWGLWDRPDGHGGGDNTYFIQQMYKFIDDPANDVAYQAYFDYNTDTKGNHKLETLSKAGAQYQKLFGK